MGPERLREGPFTAKTGPSDQGLRGDECGADVGYWSFTFKSSQG